jgi:membrane protease YdiL (CAAX protease family)
MDSFDNGLPPDGANLASETPQPVPPPQPAIERFPPDLRVSWGWFDIFVFILVSLAAYFISAVAIIAGFMARGMSIQHLQDSPRLLALFVVLNTLCASVAQLGYLYLRTRVLVGRPFWRSLGWWSFDSLGLNSAQVAGYCIFSGVALSVVVNFLSNLVGHKHALPIELMFQDRRSVLLLMILAVTIAPLVEETIFRGYLYPVVARSLGIPAAVILTGILFGLLHAMQLAGAWAQTSLLVLVGIVFTFVRAKSKTVLASYLTHLSYNGTIFLTTVIQTHGLRNIPFTH